MNRNPCGCHADAKKRTNREMVVHDGFRVSLFDPHTEKNHEEFIKDGITYVEASPDAEYFIDLECIGGRFPAGVRRVEAHFFVDGKDLGHRQFLSTQGYTRSGLWNGNEKRALAFTLPRLGHNPTKKGRRGVSTCEAVTSQVTVCLHESLSYYPGDYPKPYQEPCPTCERITAILNNENESDSEESDYSKESELYPKPEIKFFDHHAEYAQVSVSTATDKSSLTKKKEMRSVAGKSTIPVFSKELSTKPASTTTHSAAGSREKISIKKEPVTKKKAPVVKKKYIRGKYITDITIKYRSTVGLIVAGILPKPYPEWTPPGSSVAAPVQQSVSNVDLERITKTITYKDDNGLKHQAFALDLTEFSDDEV